MRVLVINTNRERSPQALLPIGACLVAAAAERAGQEVRFLDLCFSRDPRRAAAAAVASFSPDVIGLSIRNLDNCDYLNPHSYLPAGRDLVATLRAACSAEIVLGGSAVSQVPFALARYLGCRWAVVGAGEVTFPALLQALADGADPAALPGVADAEREDLFVPAPPGEDLSAPQSPALERWLDLSRYRARDASWPVQSKRGCASRCTYCVYPLLEGATYRRREPELVREEAATARRAGLRLVEFVDSIFGLPADHALACCEALARRPVGLPLSAMELNPAAITPELVGAMNAAGFSGVAVTAESGSDAMLASLGKGFTAEALGQARDHLRHLRASVMWIFLLGGPGETPETVRETARFLDTLPPSHLVLVTHGVRVLPRTALHGRLLASGELSPAEDLLLPTFYHSPAITPAASERILAESRFPVGSRVMLGDGGHRWLPLAQRVMATCGVRPPYWRQLRSLNRLRRVLGA
ncbi:MAG TPA: radical SAM protein [Armatimonadota bacterium]|jgi:radical SAM superfamily enzyme YgiQ (UPF0313 family)